MTSTLLMTPPAIRRHTASDSDRVTKKSPSNKEAGSKSSRNVKAWTSDEERILLQDRVDRVPYRQIAARLGKTDLACRLHFHQMLMAKRTPQNQAGRSIIFLSSDHPPEIHHLNPAATASSVQSLFSYLPNDGSDRESNAMATALPLFQESRFHQRSAPCSCKDAVQPPTRHAIILPYTPHHHGNDSSIDLGRLIHNYHEHSGDSRSVVGAKYSRGERLIPTEVENAFADDTGVANCGYFGGPLADVIPTRSASAPVSRETSVDLSQMQQVRSSSSMSIAGKSSVEFLLNHDDV